MLREIRCHNPKCKNTYLAENGRRRLCDACRLGKPKRPYYRLPEGMDIKTYNRNWMKNYRERKRAEAEEAEKLRRREASEWK
jgi:hypothetical protein